MRGVPFALTEEALALLSMTYADFIQVGHHYAPVGRIDVVGSLGAYDFTRVRIESAYLRLVSIVEAYIDSLCSDLFRSQLSGQSAMFQRLVAAAELQASSNWQERKSAFNGYHGVSLGQCKRWSEVNAAVEVRNAIAHGLGALTTRQKNSKSRGQMKSVGVDLSDDRLLLSDKTLGKCRFFSSEFIKSVDEKIRMHRS